jgi:hypothetical protein
MDEYVYTVSITSCFVWSEEIAAESTFATDEEATTCVSVCGV